MQTRDRKKLGALLICLTICLWINFPSGGKKPARQEDIPEVTVIQPVVITTPTPTPTPIVEDVVEEITPEVILTEDEYEYIARCAFAEAGNQGYLGQVYVIDCILNRFDTGNYSNYIDVINAPGQFSVARNGVIKAKPTEETYKALDDELITRTNYEIMYFRTKHYHSFGTPCFQYKDHYFSK